MTSLLLQKLKGWEPEWSNPQTIDLHPLESESSVKCVSQQGENQNISGFSFGYTPLCNAISHTIVANPTLALNYDVKADGKLWANDFVCKGVL